ncbi:MAG: hypothetical protein J6W84_02450, partial [Bacteroidales bacterium]|nr:hypothetical protein [Bacteroidales bacterium]
MTKYSFILLDKDLNRFLEQLQEWGVVDITRTYKPADDTSRDYIELSKRYSSAIRELKNFKVKGDYNLDDAKISDENLLEQVEAKLERARALASAHIELQKERAAAQLWGDFNAEDLKRLDNLNLLPHFYMVAEPKFNEAWTAAYPIQILNRENGKVYFVALAS